jgi:CRP-like cAMP-binding protein
MKSPANIEKTVAVFSQSGIFKGLDLDAQRDLAEMAVTKQYAKDDIVFQPQDPCDAFTMVIEGLIRVSRCSATGKRLTYLLAGPGESINLVGPFTGAPRDNIAEATDDTVIAAIERNNFIAFAFEHPQVIINIIETLGQAVDSANSRILDMLDKRVAERLKRVLNTLFKKYGPVLNFNAVEIAELASTTTESALRVMGNLRKKGIIDKMRGQITILKPEALVDPEIKDLWI